MSDPLRKRVQGEPYVPSAKRENLISDAVRQVQTMNRPGPIREGNERSPGYVFIKNTTGAALDHEHAVVALGNLAILPANRSAIVFDRPVFSGVTPADGYAGKFGILAGPAKANEVVRAVVSGACWVRLLVEDEDHEFADIEIGETGYLKSAAAGGAMILWKDDESSSSSDGSSSDGDSTVWAIVRLSNGGGSDQSLYEGILAEELSPASNPYDGETYATVTLLVPDPENEGTLMPSGIVQGINRSTSLQGTTGSYCQLKTINDELRFDFVDCAADGGSSS